ncbi:DNA polymerase [Thermodesulfobacteriota bacterium]
MQDWGFKEIVYVDFEFKAPDGELPEVLCLVAKENYSGRTFRIWADELYRMKKPPFSTDKNALFVAYYASAEFGCFLELGWDMPNNVLDLFIEFRRRFNGHRPPCGFGLLGALAAYGLDRLGDSEKESMRGGPFSKEERLALLDYCESDVMALSRLLPAMAVSIDLPRALLRGKYMKAAATMERNGIPVDVVTLKLFQKNWEVIQKRLIDVVDSEYNVFEDKVFKMAKFDAWLGLNEIPWPRKPSGALNLSDDTFKEMARSHPSVAPLRELRQTLSGMRLSKLAVGSDGRNRCLLSAFQAKTGRNQPSNSKFIFGPSTWLRGLIKPPIGCGIAYIDWSQQEFAIAAVLSGDQAMMEAYSSGDPYLTFAKQAGVVPPDGTKQTHPDQRKLFKACALAVQYGMEAESLGNRIGQPPIKARELIRLHKETYHTFWKWSDAAVNVALTRGYLDTVFGWRLHIGQAPNDRSIRNFPVQANGAEILRLACFMAIEAGIKICCPVHDALLIEAPLGTLDAAVKKTQEIMAEAGRIVLNGFNLRTDVDVVKYPDRYMDSRGLKMWETIIGIINCDTTNIAGNSFPVEEEISESLLVQISNTGAPKMATQV